ncbi:MAG: hypothetical protein J5545_12250 [Bacteroidaceae bacterium]|nr:hypothetical protein [Bacteroidaceae bacterium]
MINKNYFLLFLFVIINGICSAQQMKVVEFRELPNDLTANRYGTSKTDDNGETAALIKIVTPETDFIFDGGSMGIVDRIQKPGEIWLYIPRGSQKLTINHSAFGVLRNYTYPVPIQSAKTYEMLLDIGTGVYATITAPIAKSEVYIDNEFVGFVPIYNKYLNYGKHTIQAVNGKFEGTMELYVTSDRKRLNIDIDMKDMSHLYGDVRVMVENNADIFFGGKKVGSGFWDTQLKAGNYTIVTKKADHADAKTSFTVKAGEKNEITAIAPSPYTGYLRVYTRPQKVSIIDPRGREVDLSEQTPLLKGSHQFMFRKKGYVTQTHEYTIEPNQIVADTVELERISYFKDVTFSFGGGLNIRSLMGATGIIGLNLYHHDLQLSYTFGIGESQQVNIYDANWDYQSTQKYIMNSLSVKYGYQLNLMRQFALTPQVGFTQNTINSQMVTGSKSFADGASSKCITLGVKLLLVPVKHFYLFAAPEFGIALSKDESFNLVSSESNFSPDGFAANLGFMFYF